MGMVSALSKLETNDRNPNFTLLDSAASVHVFSTKKRFSKFVRAVRGQGLLCGNDIIPIEGWGEISLSLKTRNQNRNTRSVRRITHNRERERKSWKICRAGIFEQSYRGGSAARESQRVRKWGRSYAQRTNQIFVECFLDGFGLLSMDLDFFSIELNFSL